MNRFLPVVAALGLVASGCAAAADPSPEPRIGFVRSVGWSRSTVFTIRPDGTDLVRVSPFRGESQNPELSRDGAVLAYDRSLDIYLVDADGTDRRLLVEDAYRPIWSPAGDKLLFSRYRVDTDVAIFTINADGSEPRELTNGSINYEPAWSPDGSKIVFVKEPDLAQLWTMNTDGSHQLRLTRRSRGGDSVPEWSPDGSKVVFARNWFYRPRCNYKWDIYMVNADGSGLTNLTKTCRRTESAPHWSPNGSKILFTGRSHILVMNNDGTGITRLTDGPGQNHSPVWSPDGTQIAFISDRDGNHELYIMDSDGTDETRLTHSELRESQPTWWSRGNRYGRLLVTFNHS